MGQPSGGQGISQHVCAEALQEPADEAQQSIEPVPAKEKAMPTESRRAATTAIDLFFMMLKMRLSVKTKGARPMAASQQFPIKDGGFQTEK
jgi:hypothetical protein